MAQAPIRQFSPIVVWPRIWANGSTTVSIPMRTWRVDGHGFGFLDSHPRDHQLAHFMRAHQAVGFGQLDPVVDAERLARILDLHRIHDVSRAVENFHHVGEVVFPGRIVGADSSTCFQNRSAR